MRIERNEPTMKPFNITDQHDLHNFHYVLIIEKVYNILVFIIGKVYICAATITGKV